MDPATLQREVAEYLGAATASGTDPHSSTAASTGEGSGRGGSHNPAAAAAAADEAKGRRSGDAAAVRWSSDTRARSLDKGGLPERRNHSLDSTGLWSGAKGHSKQPGDGDQARGMFKAIRMALRHPRIWIIPLLVFLALAVGGVLGVVFVASNETRQRRLAAQGFAINAAVAFERQLQSMFFPLVSLATIIRRAPNYRDVNATFDSVAKELMEQMPSQGVTHLVAAPQGVLRNFYPLAGYCLSNCSHMNINLFTNAERRAVALSTVAKGRLMLQGPLTLSQGYFGVAGRMPVFIDNARPNDTFGAPDGLAHNCSVCYNASTGRQFWGFVNAIINLQPLVSGNDSRMSDLRAMGYWYQLYKFEANGSRTTIAHSHTLPVDPVVTDVHVPGGEWFLQVSPEHGWVPMWRGPVLAAVVLVCFVFGLLLGAILVSAKLQTWLKAANEELAREQGRMDVLLARQHNLLSCMLQEGSQHGGNAWAGGGSKSSSLQHRTLARIEDMRREIGVAQATHGATAGGADELQLIELLDEGTYGKVFKGLWRGSEVAVKTQVLPAKMSGAEKRERMAVMEAAISSTMQHPNIVQTFTYIIKPCRTTVACANWSEGGSSSAGDLDDLAAGAANGSLVDGHVGSSAAATVHNYEVSLVLEYCDWGSLRTALDKGAFFADDNSLNFPAILDTAVDVARAMLHLHRNQVIHSDLKVRNILMKSDASPRGCIAKVADFGLAVQIDCMATHVSAFQGTLSHLAPEALLHGRISKAADVYAFGITLWELFTGGQAYQGIPRALVGHKVAVLGLRPTLPPFTPPEYRSLVEDCWHGDPDKRPTFEVVLARLVRMRSDLAGGGASVPTPPLQRYRLEAKDLAEARNSSERAPDGALLNAQQAGLLHLGSYCGGTGITGGGTTGGSLLGSCGMVGADAAAVPPLQPARRSMEQQQRRVSVDLDAQLQPARRSMDQQQQQMGGGGSFGSGDGPGLLCNGGGSGSGGPPPATLRCSPRSAYLRSGLYAMPGSQLVPILDTEEEPEAADAAAQPTPQQQPAAASSSSSSIDGDSSRCNGHAGSNSVHASAAAADDSAVALKLPQASGCANGAAACVDSSSSARQQQQPAQLDIEQGRATR